jgi:tetratricopeptide (TPR) repeat protein
LGLLDTATRPDAAQHHLEQSLQFAEIVARRHPEVPSYQVSLAQTYNALAQFFTSRNQPDRALAAYREAVRLRGPLVEREPDNVYMAIGLAEALMNLSTVEDPVEGPTTAEATLRRALSVLGPFADQGPVVIELRRAAGGTWQNLASTLREQARLDEALEAHRRSIDLLDAAVLDAPHDATARALCLNAHGAAALTKGAAGLHAESLADWDRVVELADEAAAAKYRWMRAAAAAQAGEHARTMAEVNDLSRGATSDDQRYNVACLCSLASAAARSDCRLDDDERARLSDEYAQRAIQVLDGLREAGYFRDPAHAAALEADTDLAPLRQIAAFKALTTPSGKSPAE